MHLTRKGFSLAVLVYLLPLILIDFVSNTVSTGAASDFAYYKLMFDGLLAAYTAFQLFQPDTMTVAKARVQVQSDNDVVDFTHVGAFEYIYCGVLSLYSAANWYFLHGINKEATGIVSIGSAAWSFLSIGIAILAAVQFWHLKSGKIVELKKQIVN